MSRIGIKLDVVGLDATNNGRSCRNHECCGQVVRSGDIIVFRGCEVIVNNIKERGIAAHLMKDGYQSCRVGFLKRHMIRKEGQLEGVRARVVQVLSPDAKKTTNKSDRAKYHHNKGACVVECTSEWQVPTKPKNKKRAIDCGVLIGTDDDMERKTKQSK